MLHDNFLVVVSHYNRFRAKLDDPLGSFSGRLGEVDLAAICCWN